MKKALFALAALIVLVACGDKKNTIPMDPSSEVPFEVAKNYFFKNGQEIPSSPKITKEEDFTKLFGMATMMGDDGQATEIDFDKKFVLAIVLPVTEVETEIIPIKVEKKGNSLYYTYDIKTGKKQTFSTQPVSIIVLDRQYVNQEVILCN